MAGDSHFQEPHIIYPACIEQRSNRASLGKQVPAGPARLHEVKHDGYRLIV